MTVGEWRTAGLSMHYDVLGGVDIKLDDFVYVHINYDYRYTDNASRTSLAQKIMALLGGAQGGAALTADDIATLRHARTFLATREKMHPTGLEQWDEMVSRLDPSQKGEK